MMLEYYSSFRSKATGLPGGGGNQLSQRNNNSTISPYYIQIVGSIRYDIDSGKLQVGDKLPSEAELCSQYNVSRVTVRRALNELKRGGYLETKQGKGTYVKSTHDLLLVQSRAEIDVQSYTDSCVAAGFLPGSIELGTVRLNPTEEEAEFFGLEDGEQIISHRRVRTADGLCIMYEDNRFPVKGFEFLEDVDLSSKSLYTCIKDERGLISHMMGECRLTSARAVGDIANCLQVPDGEPLFVLHASYGDQFDRPLYVGVQKIVGSRYSFAL